MQRHTSSRARAFVASGSLNVTAHVTGRSKEVSVLYVWRRCTSLFVVRALLEPHNPSPCTLSGKADIWLFAALCLFLSYFFDESSCRGQTSALCR